MLEINPAVNPAILETATWDPAAAWRAVEAVDDAGWQVVEQAIGGGNRPPVTGRLTPHAGSAAHCQGSAFLLAGLPDGQQVFVEISPGVCQAVLGAPIGTKALASGGHAAVYKTDAATIDRFFRLVNPGKGPKALGPVPRLGIGTRMTTLLWPGIWQAMAQGRFAANAIQNSVRELNLLDNLLAGRPPEVNYAFNFGTIETGYTGSTFEGLWVSGVLEALKSGHRPTYGADADHLQVKRGADGLARAKRLVDASRYYTFFTLDVSDVLNYAALSAPSGSAAEGYLDEKIHDAAARQAVLDYHRQERRIGGAMYRLDGTIIDRLVGKYWDALDAVQELTGHIQRTQGRPGLRPGAEHRRAPGRGPYLRLPDDRRGGAVRDPRDAAARDTGQPRRAQLRGRKGGGLQLSGRAGRSRKAGAVAVPHLRGAGSHGRLPFR